MNDRDSNFQAKPVKLLKNVNDEALKYVNNWGS